MKLLNWNMFYQNSEMEDALDFVYSQDADIISLQEVPLEAVKLMNSNSDYHSRFAIDSINREPNYLAILSKEEPIKEKSFPLKIRKEKSLLARLLGWNESVHGLYLDVPHEEDQFRVLNIHLENYAGPLRRKSQLERALKFVAGGVKNKIVCGDFNSFGRTLYNLAVGIPFGYKLKEFFINEKNLLKKTLNKHNLQDPFEDTVTYPSIQLCLDKILTPKSMNVKKEVIKELYESDHYPITLEIV